MATPLPLPVEDQTDEDFFDKLVDDDFGTVGSRPEAGGIARAFSNMSISDVGDAGFAAEEDERHENMTMQLIEAPAEDANHATLSDDAESVGSEENTAQLGSFACDKEVSSRGSVEMAGGVVSPGSSMGRSAGSKGAGVKEVQWSSFSVDSQHLGSGGFGSDSDFLTENVDSSDDILRAENDRKSSVAENSLTDPGTYKGSSGLQDAQFYGLADGQVTNGNDSQYWADGQVTNGNDGQYWADGQVTNGNDGQYWADGQVANGNDSQDWENLYPGWKFDSTTGQWYQVDGYDTGTNAHSDSYNVVSGSAQENFQSNVQEAADGLISDQETNISYLQQMSKSVVGETIAEDCVTDNVSIWNQVSQGSTEYPPNMVFDPQYPGWYYDTSTQQWHTLESYNQTVLNTAYKLQEQLGRDVNASDDFNSKENASVYNEFGQFEKSTAQGQVNQDTGRDWPTSNYVQQNMWQSEPAIRSVTGVSGNQQTGNFHGSMGHTVNYTNQQNGFGTLEHLPYSNGSVVTEFQSFVPAENIYQYNHPKGQSQQGHFSHNFYGNQNSTNYSQEPFQRSSASYSPLSYAHNEGRSSAGRPPHALVTFGFGGKLVIMKDAGSFGTTLDYGSQDIGRGSISVLSLMEVVKDKTDASGIITGNCDYFHALCQQTFPGPLVGGNAATKDVNKWIDEKITHCEPPVPDFRKGELLRLLLSLLKISCQHYGKLRSPYGTDLSLEETDGPESAVTKLFASARKNGGHQREYVSFTQCMQSLPSEGQIRATAVEVQSLLVSGKRKEALHCAQAGQLWGPALVLAAQLGEKFYVDTVKQMAHRQFISGSPLRTLCLLIAGQPADVFSAESSTNGSLFGAVHAHQQPTQTLTNGMLDEWEENLAIITANRTKDDELVIVHLGDCLWKERGEIAAAHTCYLVAEANFESFSDTARLCLIGADHWKCPRTYASPEAIQRTELYEYSKVLGNSQFILLPFQPYKLIYAYMLAEVGRVSDSLRYCQASLKLLKNSGRSPEVELWKLLLTSLEERLRTHQQGGYSTNLAPAKLVGKIFTSIDRSIHRMMGAPPSPLPPMPQSGVNGKESGLIAPKVANSQSTMAMTSLNPSPSVEAISDWPGDGSRKNMHSRSISEPDFGRSPKQDRLKDAGSPDARGKMSLSGGPTRFGRIGSQLLQKTMGWVSRSRQAKLGESNKFYYDEKLKRWVEEGAEPPAEEAVLPPPPTTTSLQNGMSDYTISSSFKSQSLVANGEPETKSPIPSGHSSGIPPISPSPNQFSARGRSGVRSRYVDTFNKGGGAPANSFQSPSVPSVKPPVGAKFFTPSPPAASDEQIADATGENIHEDVANGRTSTSVTKESSFSTTPPTLQRFPSMDNIADSVNKGQRTPLQNGVGSLSSFSRAASWSGGYGGMSNPKAREARPLGDGRGAGLAFMPTNPSNPNLGTSARELNGGSFGEELHEVEL